jgi:hypothetical protein
MHDKFDKQPICTSMLTRFYSCKKRVLHHSDKQNQPFEGVGLDRSLRGRPLASSWSPSFEETGPPGLGVQQTPRSNLGNQ